MPLQKSFSEQHHGSSRTRPHWQRAKSHAGMNPAAATSTNGTERRPLEKISESSKNKLQAFHFHPRADDAAGDQKLDSEPHGGYEENTGAAIERPEARGDEEQGQSRSQPSELVCGEVAVTPISRLAWQDLIGMPAKSADEDDPSPNERIGWDTTQGLRDDPSPITTRRRRPKKRARSSSPTSSPAQQNTSTTPTVNIQELSAALRSPHADPALELWDRFSMAGSATATPLGHANPALAHIMMSSSPRPSRAVSNGKSVSSESSLRRAISCGMSWPSKRRKVDRGTSDFVSLVGAVQAESPSAITKSSMVNDLLKTVDGQINSTEISHARDCDPESLPLGGNRPSTADPVVDSPRTQSSPTQYHRPRPLSAGDMLHHHAVATISVEDKDEPSEKISDYGDGDFDEDTLMELDAQLAPGRSNDSHSKVPQNAEPNQTHPLPTSKQANYDDDFADMDDEVFAAAEDLLSQIDSTHTTHHKPQPTSDFEVVTSRQPIHGGLEDDYGDEFDLDAADLAMLQTATQTVSGSVPLKKHKPKAIQRYMVTKVLPSEYTDDRGRTSAEKILLVQVDRSTTMRTVHLRGDWTDTEVSQNAYIHVLGAFEQSGRCIIDNNQNILILHPDQLISATVVADSFTCMRRAVLQDRVKATSDASAPLVYGTLLHEIFQEAMMLNQWSNASMSTLIDRISERHVEDLYRIKVSMSDAREHLQSKMTELQCWAAAFVASRPKANAIVQGRNGGKSTMCVSKLLDIEEHVWSPLYGLKGNIDATVQVTMQEGTRQRTLTVPFEVKTGKNATSNHQAQTSLYNLLLSDRYDIEIAYGILYYMETSQTLRIPTIRHELRHMIMQRNQLACHIRERSVKLPSMKRSTNTCSNCYAKTSCFIYHRLADDGDSETSGMKTKFDDVVKHLTPAHRDFFLKWEDLLTKEEKEGQRFRRELWTMLSSEREKVGRCFANVTIEEGSAVEENDSPKINRYRYTFVKEPCPPGFSFLDSQLAVGEPIVVSDEQGHFALALGFVTSVRKKRISVAVDRRLHNARVRRPGFDEVRNQTFASIMEVVPEGSWNNGSSDEIKPSPIQYRLDKDEFSNGMATVRNNLVQLMANDVFGSREIRRLVVDLASPTFKTVSTHYSIADSGSLNVDQRKAIDKVMSANEYALVLGMPGTGKTTTIAHIIRALVCQGKSVLLTSYTHSAVDNILLKLKNDKMPILRLGAPAKVHPEVQEFAVLAGQPKSSFEEIRAAWHDTPIVATTCLGVSHSVFSERTFDYCIVDEASQITLPICVGPIRLARKFVLVGDHNQLPPLVQNEEARVGGLDVSLFKLLSDTHPGSVVNLEHQYRMCEDIMTLSNTLIYEGRLKCGTEELRNRKLEIPNLSKLQTRHHDAATILRSASSASHSFCASWASPSCWLRVLLEPEARVRFVNTDALPASREEAKGSRIVNPTEVRIVTQLVEALLAVGVPASEIGVMTHYRSQLSLLKHNLRGHGAAVELHTADRFQGRDKEVVVLSLVRSNEGCNIGDLLKDWRRINVAFTRAKTKLLVVGSRDTLRGCGDAEMVSRFIRLMEDRDWVHDLPVDALESHWFEEEGTQATNTAGPVTQRSPARMSPSGSKKEKTAPRRQGGVAVAGKENLDPKRSTPKKGVLTEKAILKGKPVLAGIFSDIMSDSCR